MMVNIEKVIQSWNVASEDLNIKFTSDYEVEGYIFIGLVPQFGAQKGMLLWQEFDISMGNHLVELGYGYSCVGNTFNEYNRKLFIEALLDWGWADKSLPAPFWYGE